MLYLSKGIAEKDSTENLIKVCRGDYTCGDGMFIVQTPRSEASCECDT